MQHPNDAAPVDTAVEARHLAACALERVGTAALSAILPAMNSVNAATLQEHEAERYANAAVLIANAFLRRIR